MPTKQELEVNFILQDITQLLYHIETDPLAYEEHLPCIQDIKFVATNMVAAIHGAMLVDQAADNLKAMCINASNKSSDAVMAIKLGGL